jgi:hypothetical protein
MYAMEFTLEFGGDTQDVTVTMSGIADPVDFKRYNDELASDPRFRAGMTILVDASALDTSQLAAEGLQAASHPMVERDWNYPPLAVAVIAPDPRTFKDLVLARAHLGGSSSQRRLFVSRDDALDWLNQQRDTAHS